MSEQVAQTLGGVVTGHPRLAWAAWVQSLASRPSSSSLTCGLFVCEMGWVVKNKNHSRLQEGVASMAFGTSGTNWHRLGDVGWNSAVQV